MPIELAWRTSLSCTALHLAEGVGRGRPIADPRLEPARGEATAFAGAVAAAGVPAPRLWRNLHGSALATESPRQLVETALVKTVGRGHATAPTVDSLAPRLATLLAACRNALPEFAAEAALRERPLREQWEARGPGLLWQIGKLTEEALVPSRANVVLVHPVFGGGGEAHLAYNAVRLEAVLANPHEDLPEVVRLAWLLAQLELDVPKFGEHVHPDRLPHIARFAALPPALAAAELVELVRHWPRLVPSAISAWGLAAPHGVDAAALVLDWWQTYEVSRPPIAIALQALDQMFG